jgi:hypothetical protein
VDPKKLAAIGFARREPILAVTRRVIERAEQLKLPIDSPQHAAEHVSVWLCTVKFMLDLEETTEDRLRLIRTFVRQGFDYIGYHEDNAEVDEAFLEPFKAIVVSLRRCCPSLSIKPAC